MAKTIIFERTADGGVTKCNLSQRHLTAMQASGFGWDDAKIATEICYSITGSASLVTTTFQLYQQKLSLAKNVDATEGAPQRIEASDFIESRF